MAKAEGLGTDIALRCVALCGSIGYGEGELLEKWARDAKILDLFEGTQQIQLLIVARQFPCAPGKSARAGDRDVTLSAADGPPAPNRDRGDHSAAASRRSTSQARRTSASVVLICPIASRST